jgi:hypothetical protein
MILQNLIAYFRDTNLHHWKEEDLLNVIREKGNDDLVDHFADIGLNHWYLKEIINELTWMVARQSR